MCIHWEKSNMSLKWQKCNVEHCPGCNQCQELLSGQNQSMRRCHITLTFPDLVSQFGTSSATITGSSLGLVHSAGRVPKMASVMWHVIMHLQHNFMVSIIFWAPQSPIDIETSLNQCIRYLLCYSEKKNRCFLIICARNHLKSYSLLAQRLLHLQRT